MNEWKDSRRERGEGERKKEERGKRKKRGRELEIWAPLFSKILI